MSHTSSGRASWTETTGQDRARQTDVETDSWMARKAAEQSEKE